MKKKLSAQIHVCFPRKSLKHFQGFTELSHSFVPSLAHAIATLNQSSTEAFSLCREIKKEEYILNKYFAFSTAFLNKNIYIERHRSDVTIKNIPTI